MTFTVEFTGRARSELLSSLVWYEDKQSGLGDRLAEMVQRCIRSIQKSPDHYTKRKYGFREMRVPDFPFLIIFKLNKRKSHITISSIFHTSKNPSGKYKK